MVVSIFKTILKIPLYLLIFILEVLKYTLLALGTLAKGFLAILGAGRR